MSVRVGPILLKNSVVFRRFCQRMRDDTPWIRSFFLMGALSCAFKLLASQYRLYVTPNAGLGGEIHSLFAILRKF